MQINFGSRSVSCKIVFYGPGLSGKTTNIQKIHEMMPQQRKSELTSIKTDGDRTLFFDFMSLDLGKVSGMDTRFQIYTVPGQVYYNATRKLVLQGADGIVFVADSGPGCTRTNLESWSNLKDNLAEKGLKITDIPLVIQWNKRDLAGATPIDEMNAQINETGAPTFEAVAARGTGVLDTLKTVCALVCRTLNTTQKTLQPRMSTAHVQNPAPRPAVAAVATAAAAAAPTSAGRMQFSSRHGASATAAVTATTGAKRQAPQMKKKAVLLQTKETERRTDWTPVLIVVVFAITAIGVAMLLRGMNVI